LELPAHVEGECCPTCVVQKPSCDCATTEICVVGPPQLPGQTLVVGCVAKKTVSFTFTPAAANVNALANMNSAQVSFLVLEIVARWCDHNSNGLLCRRRNTQLINSQISGVLNADGTYTVTVSWPTVDDDTDGGQPHPVSGDSYHGDGVAFAVARFVVQDDATNGGIYFNAAVDAEATDSGYSASNYDGGSPAAQATPTVFTGLAALAIALIAARRF